MAKYIGKGADISFGPSATGPWTKIPQAETIGELRSQSAQVNVTDLDSEEEEFIPGIKSPQSTACSIIWDPQNIVHQQVLDDAEAGVSQYFRIQVRNPVGSVISTAVFFGSYLDVATGPFSNTEASSCRSRCKDRAGSLGVRLGI